MKRSWPALILALSMPLAASIAQMAVDPLRRAVPSAEYVRRAAANDLYQRQSAPIILRASRTPEIRQIAQTLNADHVRAAADLRAAAIRAGVRIDAALSTVEFKQMVGKLTLATPETRDALYLTQQRAVHRRALALHEDYAKGGDNPELQAAAARIAAIERAHLDMLDNAAMPVAPLATSASAAPMPSPGQ